MPGAAGKDRGPAAILVAHVNRSPYASRGRDEERFGLEYDLDVYNIVAVSDFNMGGPPHT